jgi:hypothetical protein
VRELFDESVDVFVSQDVLVAVIRGDRISTAQLFGVDWCGPKTTVVHAGVFSSADHARVEANHHARVQALEKQLASSVAALPRWQRAAMAVAYDLGVAVRWWRSCGVACWYVLAISLWWLWFALR